MEVFQAGGYSIDSWNHDFDQDERDRMTAILEADRNAVREDERLQIAEHPGLVCCHEAVEYQRKGSLGLCFMCRDVLETIRREATREAMEKACRAVCKRWCGSQQVAHNNVCIFTDRAIRRAFEGGEP